MAVKLELKNYIQEKIMEYNDKLLSSTTKEEVDKYKEILSILLDIRKICIDRNKF